MAFSFDSQYFATSSDDKSIKVFDIKTKELVHQFSAIDGGKKIFFPLVTISQAPILDASWSPDNRYIVTGNTDIQLYDLQTKSHAMTLENPHKKEGNTITEVIISPNGKTLCFTSTKKYKGYPEIYRLDPNLSGGSSSMTSS